MKKRVNYDFERRKKEQDRQRKKEPKLQRKQQGNAGQDDAQPHTDEAMRDSDASGPTTG